MAIDDQKVGNPHPFIAPRYSELEYVTARTVSTLKINNFLFHHNPQYRYIGQRVQNLRRVCGALNSRTSILDQLAVIEALALLVKNSEKILLGSTNGMDCIRKKPGLWNRVMCEWPMGEYGRVLAEYINVQKHARGKILELGAGVGHASKFIKLESGATYIKSDINKTILQMYNRGHIIEEYDIDWDYTPFNDLDLVFASNVLHCARDKIKTLRNIYEMLRPGAYLVFSEGTPEVSLKREWCLSVFFGFFDGWWDRGGFISLESWSEYISSVGFITVTTKKMACDQNELGMLYVAQKPHK